MAREERVHEWTTVHVSNVPLDTHRVQLENVFAGVGPIKKCFVVKGRDDAKTTIGFVTFAMGVDAKAAIEQKDLKLGENSLKLKLAPNTKLKDRKKPAGKNPAPDGGNNPAPAAADAATDVKKEDNATAEENTEHSKHQNAGRTNPRKARLIIRNLSFKTTDKSLRAAFSKFGELSEVNILKRADGKMVGCAFIQYKNANNAAKAIKEQNAKELLGRPVAVDWAVPKEVFKGPEKKEVKEEEIKDEEVKDEPESDDEDESGLNSSEVKIEEDNDDDDDSDDNDDSEDDDSEEEEKEARPKVAHNFSTGHDIDEGKTVFIKNIAYETDEGDLRDMMNDLFGPVHFARLVLDKVMQHPRGTGFVKFKNAEHAAKCVEISEGKDGIFLDKRQLNCCLAIKQGDVSVRQEERKKKEEKDSRNLYLAREGMIREGTQAADGVSDADIEKRKSVERYKKSMLKNLSMFVSDVRLCIRNLPPSYDDKKLTKLCKDHAPQNARITEAKVIRDMNNKVNDVAVSKEYGFVTFNRHLDAIAALRNLNNNPEVFGSERRPIVDFSIENKKAIQARQKRLERSKQNNPNYKKGSKPTDGDSADKKDKKGAKKSAEATNEVDRPQFAGAASDPKVKNLPKHTGAKIRTNKPKITRRDLRKKELERKNPKLKRKRPDDSEPARSTTSTSQPAATAEPTKKKSRKEKRITKSEKNDAKENKAFDSLVNQYKNKFTNNQQVLKKWFDT